MLDFAVVPAYLVAVLLICIAPGPDMAYMVAAGMAGGRAAALRAAAGVATGVFAYAIATSAGLGILIIRYDWAFTALRVFGGLYLLWLAWQAYRQARRAVPFADDDEQGDWFRRGLLVNLSNPKMVLFFLSFLPQFRGTAHNSTAQFCMLGACYMLLGFVIDLTVGAAAGTLRTRLVHSSHAAQVLNYAATAVFAVLSATVFYELLSQ